MMSRLSAQTLVRLLAGLSLVLACSPSLPGDAPGATPGATVQPSPTAPPASPTPAPTERAGPLPATESPTPTATEQPLVVPAGRLLLAVVAKAGGKYPGTDVYLFPQYRWLDLPGMTVSPHPLLTGEYPNAHELVTLSPDGAQIAVFKFDGTPEVGLNLYVMNADGSNDRVLATGWINSNVVWDPAGTRIFFIDGRADEQHEPSIYSVDVASGVTTLVTVVSKQAQCLTLAPDGSLLTYFDGVIRAVSPEGGEPRRLLDACGGGSVSSPVWSPDGQSIALASSFQVLILDQAGNCQALDYPEEEMAPWTIVGWLPS